ncbi:MAG: S-methyl-5-thioribose-1-phosphate isomerase [Eggerthellaceae bacterium]|jgi:methylthioribose-1-phosphate isomerase
MGVENLPRTIEIITRTADDGFDRAALRIIDQRKLPAEKNMVVLTDYRQVISAVKVLAVRGAPALGVTGAAAVAMWATEAASGTSDADGFRTELNQVANEIATARPTAVNLSWGVNCATDVILTALGNGATIQMAAASALSRAQRMEEEDEACNRAIGKAGAALLPEGARVLTHCNAGSLATVFYGTALGVVYAAHERGHISHVYCDETRPVGQGARLTAWELTEAGIPCTVQCDDMAAMLMKQGLVDAVIVGADRICANGDTANKIGTYQLAIAADYHRIPFYVAAPTSTIDISLDEGSQIPIEFRDPSEVCDVEAYPRNVYNPAFDVTPAELINAIITERGVIRPAVHESGALYNLRKFMSLKDVL